MNQEIAIIGVPPLPTLQPKLSPQVLAQKETALSNSALIGKVTTKEENDAATVARKGLAFWRFIDKQRKEMTDPYVDAQRLLIRIVEPHIDELKREDGRLENLQKEFALSEQRRVREEQEAQQRELARIEAERQAELQRIADEQARIEREAQKAREDAEKLASEATNKKQREAAEKARVKAEEQNRIAQSAAAKAAQETARVEENADLRARIESKPVEMTRAVGQTNRKVWVIKQINDFQLMRARPDLVRKIEWDITGIKEILNAGGTLPGVIAEEDLKISTRGNTRPMIDV